MIHGIEKILGKEVLKMFKELKRFISSMDLAIILIAAISGLSISSTFFDTPEVFSSTPFRILVGFFFLNLFTCSVKLWPNVLRTLRRQVSAIEGKEANFKPVESTKEELLAYLKAGHYHHKASENGRYLLATKNKLSFLAPHILHIGLLVIIVGSFLTTFQVTDTIKLASGESLSLPKTIEEKVGKGKLSLTNFETLYDEMGNVKNWVSTFDLEVDSWQAYKDKTASVNHPFKEHGLSIYQMAFSNAYLFHVVGDESVEGDYVFPEDQMIPLRVKAGANTIQLRPMTKDVSLFYAFDESGNQITEKAMKIGDKFVLDNGLTLTFEKKLDYTVLQVKYNPYLPVVFLGFILSSFACMLFWLGRYREIWCYFDEENRASLHVITKSKDLREKIYHELKEVKEA